MPVEESPGEVDRVVAAVAQRVHDGAAARAAVADGHDPPSRRQAREMRLEMEDWADNNLASLEVNLERFLTAVKRGRERLHERSQETVVAGLGADDGDDGY